MSEAAWRRHPSLYLLGDHLDVALAMGEDLLAQRVALAGPTQTLTQAQHERQSRNLADFLATARSLELAVTARLLQARRRAEDLKRVQGGLKPLISLFIAGTAPLVDAAADLGDNSERDFETGADALSFLRSRAVIARDTAGLERLSAVAVTEDYLVGSRIRLGALLDLAAAFLDALELMFDLRLASEQTVDDETASKTTRAR
jgi:hypothetical protein